MSTAHPSTRAESAADAQPLASALREPRRARGQLRVEALLASAADVFAEKGFEAATMTEIAARADSSIGSLYQFFRTKEAIAEALVRTHVEALWTRFDAVAADAPAMATPALGRALAGLLVGFRAAHPSFAALVETPETPLQSVAGVRREVRERIAALLQRHAPAAPPACIEAMAPVVQQAMKAATQIQAEFEGDLRARALVELETMLSGYLVARLAAPR